MNGAGYPAHAPGPIPCREEAKEGEAGLICSEPDSDNGEEKSAPLRLAAAELPPEEDEGSGGLR